VTFAKQNPQQTVSLLHAASGVFGVGYELNERPKLYILSVYGPGATNGGQLLTTGLYCTNNIGPECNPHCDELRAVLFVNVTGRTVFRATRLSLYEKTTLGVRKNILWDT
jgi:hypothetical protein